MPRLRTTIFATLLLTLAACSRVTVDNYAKLETGMSRAEVHALLGAPDPSVRARAAAVLRSPAAASAA